jgi:hypothetical protein
MKTKGKTKSKFIEVTQRNARTGKLVTYRRIRSSGVIPGREATAGEPTEVSSSRGHKSMTRTKQQIDQGFAAFCARRGLNPDLPW